MRLDLLKGDPDLLSSNIRIGPDFADDEAILSRLRIEYSQECQEGEFTNCIVNLE